MKVTAESFQNDRTIIHMGPQHPSTHGVLNLTLTLRGEVIESVDPRVGYLHRAIEKIGELTQYVGFIPYTDRVDYLSAMFGNHTYCMAVEKLLGVEVPRRAEYMRVIACELNRIINHLIACGTMAMDLGAFTPFLHGMRMREKVNDMMEKICGARLNYNYMRFGGVSRDYVAGLDKEILAFLDEFETFLPEFDRLITGNEIFEQRLIHVVVIPPGLAIHYGLGGPNLRASGVDFDIRRDYPYSAYPEFSFKVITGKGFRGEPGDSFARYMVRIEEMKESAKIVRQAVEGLPEGEFLAKVARNPVPPAGEVYTHTESTRGEMGFYLVSDGTDKPFRCKIRTSSFCTMAIIPQVATGYMVADMTAFFGSLDIVAPEVDR